MKTESFFELSEEQKLDLTTEGLKKISAEFAVELIEPGMVVGLGTGTTAKYAVEAIGKKLAAGHLSGIVGIPSSVPTERLAKKAGISLSTFAVNPIIDINIDGADEADDNLNLIKGGGGALLREKIVAEASHRNIIVVDESKISSKIGEKWCVPIEVIPFALNIIMNFLHELGASETIQRLTSEGKPFITDNENFIVDAKFGVIEWPEELAAELSTKSGIVEHGLFLGLATDLIISSPEGLLHRRIIAD